MSKPIKLSDCHPGLILYPDAGFTCMGGNHPKEVKVGSSGNLFIECSSGEHNLDGQLSESDWDTLVGLSLEPWSEIEFGAKQDSED